MALIKCSECGKEISDKAMECIHCGCPIPKNKSNIIVGIIGIVILLCGIIVPMNFVISSLNINATILRIPLIIVGFILLTTSALKKSKKTNCDEKNLNKMALIIIGINILITLISMIFVLIKVSSNFFKAIFPVYFGNLFINVIILLLIIRKKLKQKDVKSVSIVLLVISISLALFYSIFMINKYNDYIENYIENRDEKIDDMLSQYRCETKYNGYWSSSSGTCYYDSGSTRTP